MFHLFSILDIDECANRQDNCDKNAICTNSPGSFTCDCVADGYFGNGTICLRKDVITFNNIIYINLLR